MMNRVYRDHGFILYSLQEYHYLVVIILLDIQQVYKVYNQSNLQLKFRYL